MRPEPPAPDYLAAYRLRESFTLVTLGGEERKIQRARLGRHHELARLAPADPDAVLETALTYVVAASGVPEDEILPDEVAPAYLRLAALNAPRQVPAILRNSGGVPGRREPPAFRYEGRWLAGLVTAFGHYFGWTPDYVLDELAPEEAWLYLQEMEWDEHHRRDFEASLSQVGRDKRGRRQKFQVPAWARLGYQAEPGRAGSPPPPVPERLRPQGVVIALPTRRERGTG